ncbi:MAG TPA: energy transducer TonB [Rhizomicrobium sp.]|jgi:TonB family protein|nr:energy transducer TonB [Rhizomicrobium sp.]
MRKLILPFVLLLPLSALAEDDAGTPSPAPGNVHACRVVHTTHRRNGDERAGPDAVKFTVTEAGTVTDAEIVTSSGDPELDRTALSCVRAWLYVPAKKDGVAVAAGWQATIDWSASPGGLRGGVTGEFTPLIRPGYIPGHRP